MKSSILFWFSLLLQEHLIILVQYMWLGDMAGLISKIDRSSMGPLPACYYSTLKSLINSMLRENPEHRPRDLAGLISKINVHPFVLFLHAILYIEITYQEPD
ncbi:serine/threonine-protein kinase Nek6-like isoform X3 [Macadamia integrifolia]|uniref:serine/threonine-protein kinase Nek6-like isoform X2 n=1 Tax=Macadamia integrifolia TaxID=60698 RepID=UPI001C527AFD|nr:serine/threonine-protein kinase Nek6-like isoform X2 [Macadamia integrifolia]XP_042520877.1 serine/threonine-protein kinase Nek6-like isoform X3 [Macadamia integrifolia]